MVTALPPPSPGTPWAVGLVGFWYCPPTIREGLSGVDCILINDLVYCIAKVGWTMPPEAPNDVIDRVNFLDRAVLAPVVRGVLNDESACPIQGWTAQPIGGSIGVGTLGIFKLIGEATTSAGISKWSVVAKVMDLDASAEGLAHTSPLREVRAYESGILAAICSATKPENSFRAANHYGVTEIDDLGSILWVEDPSAALPSPWEDDTYLEITR